MREDVAEMFAAARRRLAGVPRELLGEVHEPGRLRRVLGGGARIVPVGEAWRLGVLLLSDDAVHGIGETLRVTDPGRRGHTADAARVRAELRAAALRGGFREGDIVHIGWRIIDLRASAQAAAHPDAGIARPDRPDTVRGDEAPGGSVHAGPLLWRGDRAMVRWSPAADPVPLAAYLDERVELLLDPPRGST